MKTTRRSNATIVQYHTNFKNLYSKFYEKKIKYNEIVYFTFYFCIRIDGTKR